MEIRTYDRMVQVRFPCMGRALDYLDGGFQLRVGDLVYVDGKLDGIQGRVVAVGQEPLCLLDAYKKVVARVDTRVEGQLLLAGSFFLTFDSAVLPYDRLVGWFRGPAEERLPRCTDHAPFPLEQPERMPVSQAIARRGHDYREEGRVLYLSLNGHRGRAIVEGTERYEVAFTCRDGQISGLSCDCMCEGLCKHQVAALEQLRELLGLIRRHYGGCYREGGYFAAVSKHMLFRHAIARRETGRLILEN